jgi:protein-arginine kinase activator protein McsA
MLCEKCKKAEATIHITEIIGDAPDETKTHDLCEACCNQSELGKKLRRTTGAGWTNYSPGSSATTAPDDEPDR